jgi:hypothetical protein
LLDQIAVIEHESRRWHARMLSAVGELDRRGVAGGWGHRDTAALLHERLAITRADAKRRVQRAGQLVALPILGEAVEAGVLHPDQITAIVDTIARFPSWATEEDVESTQRILVRAAPSVDAVVIRGLGREILDRLDQDGPEPREAPLAQPRNELHFTVRRSGRVAFTGELDQESGALLTGALSSFSTPVNNDGEPDLRSPAERHGDAFADILKLVADGGSLPADGGQKPHLTVTISWANLRENAGRATLDNATLGLPTTLTAGQARRIACDAKVLPIVLGSRAEPLDVGRSTRTIPAAIRKAVVFRDGGCAFPSCPRPQHWTDVHHIRHWADGGPTALENLTLLCREHHTLVHHSRWKIVMDKGIPTFIPPSYIDPQMKPRTNPLRRYALIH